MANRLRGEKDIIAFFDSEVPSTIVEELARILLQAYQAADDLCEQRYAFEEAHDLRPILRRTEAESRLASLTGKFPGQVTVTKLKNAAQNCYHGELSCGRVVITISKVVTVESSIPDAHFRRTLATSCQLNLFEDAPQQPVGTALWAVLVHGGGERSSQGPDFLHIVFPLVDGSHARGINLLQRFPDLQATPPRVQVEQINQEVDVRLRHRMRKPKAGEEQA